MDNFDKNRQGYGDNLIKDFYYHLGGGAKPFFNMGNIKINNTLNCFVVKSPVMFHKMFEIYV